MSIERQLALAKMKQYASRHSDMGPLNWPGFNSKLGQLKTNIDLGTVLGLKKFKKTTARRLVEEDEQKPKAPPDFLSDVVTIPAGSKKKKVIKNSKSTLKI